MWQCESGASNACIQIESKCCWGANEMHFMFDPMVNVHMMRELFIFSLFLHFFFPFFFADSVYWRHFSSSNSIQSWHIEAPIIRTNFVQTPHMTFDCSQSRTSPECTMVKFEMWRMEKCWCLFSRQFIAYSMHRFKIPIDKQLWLVWHYYVFRLHW